MHAVTYPARVTPTICPINPTLDNALKPNFELASAILWSMNCWMLLLGGLCVNSTMSYILAPSLVPPRSCTKASALMALTYQVAHILGLVIAIVLALWLYGDISGGL